MYHHHDLHDKSTFSSSASVERVTRRRVYTVRRFFQRRLYQQLLITFLFLVSLLLSGQRLTHAAGTITGLVFQDYNANGVFDTAVTLTNSSGTGTISTAVDRGIGSVVVRAYDAAGVLRGTATTGVNGTYSLVAAGTGPYRIEFDTTTFPAGYQSGPHGTSSSTTVQFVPDGNSSNINLGINYPADYCQNNPQLVTSCYVKGDQLTGPNRTLPSVVSFPYNAGSNRTTGTTPFTDYDTPAGHAILLTASQVGTTWGLGWSRSTRFIYAAAFFKRHSGFGSGSVAGTEPGTIYVINPATSTVVARFTVPNAPTNAHNTANYDTDNGNTGWDGVGKTSLGGLTVSDDGTTVYVMNLENRTLYSLNSTSGAINLSQAAPTALPGCLATTDARPFAVKYFRGVLYVGLVCSAESAGSTRANLRAYVYTADPTTLAFSAAPVFQVALNYSHGNAINPVSGNWQRWTPVFTNTTTLTALGATFFVDPQPMLTDIEFDVNNNIIIGLRDRAGDQGGYRNHSGPIGDPNLYLTVSAGDTLCGSPAGAIWNPEN